MIAIRLRLSIELQLATSFKLPSANMLFDRDSMPLNFHAFPDVIQDLKFPYFKLQGDELSRHIELYREKLIWHQKATAQYLGYINALQPRINLLMPREVIALVFKHLMWSFMHLDTMNCYPIFPAHHRWLKVAHVCRHWRSIALTCPELFSCLNLAKYTYPDFIPVSKYLEYSRHAPLFICVKDFDSVTLQHIIPHVSRISAVQIHIYQSQQFDVVPALHSTCTLQVMQKSEDFNINGFLPYFPNLECLYLDNKAIKANNDLPSVSLSRLTYLSLYSFATSRQSTVGMLAFLPQLKILELQLSAMEFSDDDLITVTRPLDLLRLMLPPCDIIVPITQIFTGLPVDILQIDVPWRNEYFRDYPPYCDGGPHWMHVVLKDRHTRILDLTFRENELRLESHRYHNDDSINGSSTIAVAGDSDFVMHEPFSSDSFDIDEVYIHNFLTWGLWGSPSNRDLLDVLFSLKVQTLRLPCQILEVFEFNPLATNHRHLQNLYIFDEDEDEDLAEVYSDGLWWMAGGLQARCANGLPDLELLCLESSLSTSNYVWRKNSSIKSLRASVRELRLPKRTRR